ncbi:DNA modification system-associated small protein [Paenisporosarcina sp. NPDC076898]|uniref:DNA modification system-associated small protein n=1 Tax=unclassified Paenisporosarcina TaxID=2642018 RepID=UPI003D006928
MKESKRRELELLHKLCKEKNISTALAQDLITSSKKFSYENVTQSARIKEYQELINYHTKLK